MEDRKATIALGWKINRALLYALLCIEVVLIFMLPPKKYSLPGAVIGAFIGGLITYVLDKLVLCLYVGRMARCILHFINRDALGM